MQKWIIKPLNTPSIVRNCSKCGCTRNFVCSNSFRVNANGKNLDVWLIYKCKSCDTTLNIEILSRVKPNKIDKSLYEAFLSNDKETAVKFAFDVGVLNKNKAVASYDEIEYEVIKTEADGGADTVVIFSEYDLQLRIDKLFSEQLDISRTKVRQLFESGEIEGSEGSINCKTKVKGTIVLYLKFKKTAQNSMAVNQ